jgi:hypothetical protein
VEQHVSLERAIDDEAAVRVGKIATSGRQKIGDARGEENRHECERRRAWPPKRLRGSKRNDDRGDGDIDEQDPIKRRPIGKEHDEIKKRRDGSTENRRDDETFFSIAADVEELDEEKPREKLSQEKRGERREDQHRAVRR